MVWRETGIMEERLKFVAACLSGEETMAGLCALYGISRKTGYKWLGRFQARGPAGLADLPRSPLKHGRATAADLVERIVAEKEAHPLWGPKKIVARLKRQHPKETWPAASTVGELLKRHGLVGRRQTRWKACGTGPFAEADAPNALWTADHKGWFRLGDKSRCEPLTAMDANSRYMLGLEAVPSTAQSEAWPVFERLFDEFGLPQRLRSDNGAPFASAGVTGLTPLAVRFIKLGIVLERIAPGKPQQNGRHERFHLTMMPLARAARGCRQEQQQAFDAFRTEYNSERPHEALGQTPPVEHYKKSLRPMPGHWPEPDYPAEAAVRRVRHNGEIKWNGETIYVAQSLVGEPVAVEETEDGQWTVRFHAHPLGVIDPIHNKLRRRSKGPGTGSLAAASTTPEL
ncbi:integrase [Rhizobium sp. J15]|uniref:integrase core domain-containing protein n=1 Tax=Rhizobium sp. J15 TaxID=2035450 RepID=UPI000BE934A8|nr:integrase core domain-containing protein [Rhizobium sp. J15]PDT16063.1 integrase [Rhizobium sp. J15]